MRSKLSGGDYAIVRHTFDGPRVMKKGVGVASVADGVPRQFETPGWFHDIDKVKEFLARLFPFAYQFEPNCHCFRCKNQRGTASKCEINCRACRQAVTAGRWMVVIHRWFIERMTDSQIQVDYKWKKGTVGSIVQKIRRVLAGGRQDGVKRTGRPKGRPRTEIPDNRKNQDTSGSMSCDGNSLNQEIKY
jgi:hypothetical protein